MSFRGDKARLGLAVGALVAFAAYTSLTLVLAHVSVGVSPPKYDISYEVPGRRGSIYDGGASGCPLVKSVSVWEYRLDPVALTNRVVRPSKKSKPRKPEAILRTISDVLHLNYGQLLERSRNVANRYQFLAVSQDEAAHRVLANSHYVSGIVIKDRQIRQYLHGRRLAHVIGSVNRLGEPSAGIELKFNGELSGVSGRVTGRRDALGNELYDKRVEDIAPIPGSDIHLTIDHNLQYEAETALAEGLRKFGAGSGWCVILDVSTGAVLSMASLPDFHPDLYGKSSESALRNRAVAWNYEPGSVMKVITAAAGVDCGFVQPDSMFPTDRGEEGYYKLPGDGSHVWEPMMSVRDAVIHSSNIVIGKLGYQLGPHRLHGYMKAFGFGERTGIELPGEESGQLRPPEKWDKATWSRAAIGQGVSVTAIQLASAYQAIANDGLRMRPYLVDRIVRADGTVERHGVVPVGRAISPEASRQVREMMLGVASPEGTARRAALCGYSVAGKTGTAQKVLPGSRGYAPGLYRATFCGIVPSGVVKIRPQDPEPAKSRLVILVTLDFDEKAKFHQGGNSAGPVFHRIATAAMRYLEIEPDRPDELMCEVDNDEFDQIMDARAELVEEDSSDWND